MNLLFLSDMKHDYMLSFLLERGKVDWTNEKLSLEKVAQYDWIISYGYRHIINQNEVSLS